jgi:hypothetical protein
LTELSVICKILWLGIAGIPFVHSIDSDSDADSTPPVIAAATDTSGFDSIADSAAKTVAFVFFIC